MMISILIITFRRGKRALEIFPPISTISILFREKGVSGNSRKSFISRNGGANKALEIIVSDNELWIRSAILFAGFGKYSDLIHKIKLVEITKICVDQKIVTITFNSTSQTKTTLDLKMTKAEEFFQIIKEKQFL